MDRFYLKNYLSRINENVVITFARNHNINYKYDSYVEENIGIIGGKDNVVMYAPEDNGK